MQRQRGRRAARGRSTLSIALWRPTSSRASSSSPRGVEEPGGVQAAGAREAGWRSALGQRRRAARARRPARAPPAAACTATSSSAPLPQTPHDERRVEAPRAGVAQQRPGDLDDVGREVRRSARRRAPRSIRPSPSRKPSASSSSWPGVRIVTASGSPSTRISSGSSTATSSRAAVAHDGADHARGAASSIAASGQPIAASAGVSRRLLGDRAHVDRDDLVLGARGVDVGRRADQQVRPHLREVERGEDVARARSAR